MNEPNLFRINLDVFEGFEGQWVDIPWRRTYGAYQHALEIMLTRGAAYRDYATLSGSVAGWSFAGSPADPASVNLLELDIVNYILERMDAHYQEVRRKPADRKSGPVAVDESAEDSGLLAGDGPRGGAVPAGVRGPGGSEVDGDQHGGAAEAAGG